jgi:uncharacterized protein YeaO (DUF488 family)
MTRGLPRGEALALQDVRAFLPEGGGARYPFHKARVYARPWPEGIRVLVDGLWPRGLARAEVDVWAKELAPSKELRTAYGHDPGRTEWFRGRYREELAAKTEALALLRGLSALEPVVLLYAARDDTLTNGAVLWEFLMEG